MTSSHSHALLVVFKGSNKWLRGELEELEDEGEEAKGGDSEDEGIKHLGFRLVNNGTIPLQNRHLQQAVITSEFIRTLSVAGVTRLKQKLAAALRPKMQSLEHTWLQIRRVLAPLEHRHRRRAEAAVVLELALWKWRMGLSPPDGRTRAQRKAQRSTCRVTCGSDVVVRHVLKFL